MELFMLIFEHFGINYILKFMNQIYFLTHYIELFLQHNFLKQDPYNKTVRCKYIF